MNPDRVVLLDRIPHRSGLGAMDWAGMQVSRLWAIPLVERCARTGDYRLVSLERIERVEEKRWRLSLRPETGLSSNAALRYWRENVTERGGHAFFFMRRVSRESNLDLLVDTRHDYATIAPFLDAYDLWLGLSDVDWACAMTIKEHKPPCGLDVRILAVRDAAEALEFESRYPDLSVVSCALPGPFHDEVSATITSMTYALVPRRLGRARLAGAVGALLEAMSRKPSYLNGFAPSLDAEFSVAEPRTLDRRPQTISVTDFFPNADVGECVARAIEATLPGHPVRVIRRSYREQYRSHPISDYDLAILIPVNSSPTGVLRAVLALAAPHLSPHERQRVAADIDSAERTGDVADLMVARASALATSGIGLVAHYMGMSGFRGSSMTAISTLGFAPLEEWTWAKCLPDDDSSRFAPSPSPSDDVIEGLT